MTKAIDIRDFYDREAMTSARYSTKHFWEQRYHNKRRIILKAFLQNSLRFCNTFVDIGCGTGEYLLLAKQFLNQVCGLDVSKRYLHRCKPAKAQHLIQADSRCLPFQNQVFDFVLCSEVIEHINPNENAIAEVFRLARKFALVSTPNHGLLRILMGKLNRQKVASVDSSVGHINIQTFSELLPKFRNQKWKIADAFTLHIFPPTLDEIRLPTAAAPLVGLLERVLNKILPSMGSVTIIYLQSISA